VLRSCFIAIFFHDGFVGTDASPSTDGSAWQSWLSWFLLYNSFVGTDAS